MSDQQMDLLATPEPGWMEMAMAEVKAAARSGYDVTNDDIYDKVGAPAHPNHWGALWRAAKAAGIVEVVGVRQSARKSRNGGLVRVWRGVRNTA